MKNVFSATMVFLFISLFSNILQAQESYPNIQLGLQASFPVGGISGKVNVTEKHTGQAVVGIFGPFSSYFGRYAYNFKSEEKNFGNLKPYLFGQVGYYIYDFEGYFGVPTEKEKSVGFGAGGGIEWNIKNFSDNLKFNIEISYNRVDFELYDFKSIMFGFGIHYQFQL
jgi:opacity protein-like surface antigen